MVPPRFRVAGVLTVVVVLLPAARLATPEAPRPAPLIRAAFVSAGDGRFVAPGPGGAQIGVAADRLAVRDGERFGQLRLLGADAGARATPQQRLQGVVNDYTGPRPRTGLGRFARIRYRQVWPGIDIVYRGLDQGLEYDFVVAPGADPGRIALRRRGSLPQRPPRAFQDGREIPVAFREHDGVLRVDLGAYDRARPLLIDPVVVFSTYLGGTGNDRIAAVSAAADGSLAVAGDTDSANFPTRSPAQGTFGGGSNDAFVARFGPGGDLLWSTYLGGTGLDVGYDVASGPGAVVVAGETASANFPVTDGGLYGGGSRDGFVARLGHGGNVEWATYLGGSGLERVRAVELDGNGALTAVGVTASVDFPVTPGADQPIHGGSTFDAFVTRLAADGTRSWSTFLGGSSLDDMADVTAAAGGVVWVAGSTASADFPTTAGTPDSSLGGGNDGALVRFGPGGARTLSTYFGGTGNDGLTGVAVDASGSVFLSGQTDSADLTAAPGPANGPNDGFVTRLSAAAEPLWTRLVGGSATDATVAVAVDPAGNSHAVGPTSSSDLPVTTGPASTSFIGFLASYAPDGALRRLAGTEGGGELTIPRAITIDPLGATTIAGEVIDDDLVSTPGAFQPAFGGGAADGFMLRMAPVAGFSAGAADFGSATVGTAGPERTITATNTGADPLVVVSVSAGGDYSVVSDGCTGVVAPGASCGVVTRFAPTAAGDRSATLRFTTNAAGSPHDVALSGAGTPPAVTPPAVTPPVLEPPAVEPLPLTCAGLSLVLLDVHREGRRVRVGGVALRRFAGARVTIRSDRGTGVARTTIRPDGSFAATLPVPSRRHYRRVVYAASAAGQRSPALHLYRNFVITRSRETATGLKVTARVSRGRKGQKVTLRRQVSCKKTAVTRTLKLAARGTFRVTLPRPAAGSGFVFYRVITKVKGFSAYTLPIAVRARG